jgi:hypothetical protein
MIRQLSTIAVFGLLGTTSFCLMLARALEGAPIQ